jgi:class 3 adenylate cyclase
MVMAQIHHTLHLTDKSGDTEAERTDKSVIILTALLKYTGLIWFGILLVLTASSAFLEPFLTSSVWGNPTVIRLFFIMNLGVVFSFIFYKRFYYKQLTTIANATILAQKENLAKANQQLHEQAAAIASQRDIITEERNKSKKLLLNILPKEIIHELQVQGYATAKSYECVSVLYATFKDFAQIAEGMVAEELVANLDYCFSAFDDIMSKYGLEKIKTIGDAYMATGGLNTRERGHAQAMVNAALEIRDFIAQWNKEKALRGEEMWNICIGVHTGPATAGVVGKHKFAYDVWGATVDQAMQIEASGKAGELNISEVTYQLVKKTFDCECQGPPMIGMHTAMGDRYLVQGRARDVMHKEERRRDAQPLHHMKMQV